MNHLKRESSKMNILSNSPSPLKTKDGKNFYTVRGKDISTQAEEILKRVQEAHNFEKEEWKTLAEKKGLDIDRLLVFQLGYFSKALDTLSKIRLQVPKVKSIIAVIFCKNNDEEHATYCWSYGVRMEQDTLLECHIFGNGEIHTCSQNMHTIIESAMKNEMQNEAHQIRRQHVEIYCPRTGTTANYRVLLRSPPLPSCYIYPKIPKTKMNELVSVNKETIKKDEKNFYTVRGKDISTQAEEILKSVQEACFSEIKWKTLKRKEGPGIDRLLVFQLGSFSKASDILSRIRDQVPEVKSIIAVIFCKSNDEEHAAYCRSYGVRMENDISLACHIFGDGGTHTCSKTIHKRIYSAMKNEMENEAHKKDDEIYDLRTTDITVIQPCAQTKNERENAQTGQEYIRRRAEKGNKTHLRTKMNELAEKVKESATYRPTDEKNWYDLEDAIETFEYLQLKDEGDLSNAKYIKLKKGLELAINGRTRNILAKRIIETTNSKCVDELQSLLTEAKKLLVALGNLPAYASKLLSKMDTKAMEELRCFTYPPAVIRNVMVAALMLLEKDHDTFQVLRQGLDHLLKPLDVSLNPPSRPNPATPRQSQESWMVIQKSLEGHRYLRLKIHTFDGKNVAKKTYEDVWKILQKHTVDEVRKVNVLAAAFHDWAYQVLESMHHM